jgi:hypothetical protein
MENAIEGCVRETFGALVATWQARAAGDRTALRALAGIARDETRHAELAWAVDGWARGRLDGGARRRLTAARRQAVAELRQSVIEPPSLVARRVGLPDATRTRQLLDAATAELWHRDKA